MGKTPMHYLINIHEIKMLQTLGFFTLKVPETGEGIVLNSVYYCLDKGAHYTFEKKSANST